MDPNLPFQPPPPAQPVQPTPQMPPVEPALVAPPPPAKKVSGILIAGLVLLFVSVLALVGYYFIQTKGLNVNISTPTPLATVVVAPTATPNPTADWKTYTGSGFTFNYPSNMSSLTANEAGISGPWTGNPQDIILLADKTTMQPGTDAPFSGFTVASVALGGMSFDSYLSKEVNTEKNSPRGMVNTNITKISVANQSAAYIDSESSIRRYFIPLPSGQKAIAFSTASRSDSFLKTMDQILSTFQFLK